jgi:hypothetical protein
MMSISLINERFWYSSHSPTKIRLSRLQICFITHTKSKFQRPLHRGPLYPTLQDRHGLIQGGVGLVGCHMSVSFCSWTLQALPGVAKTNLEPPTRTPRKVHALKNPIVRK